MFITDKETLKQYSSGYRMWQGIPSIEVTPKGRTFITFYSGGIREQIGNYVLLLKSDDGEHFEDPIAVVAPEENYRCFDSCLWIDPLGRLWFTWSKGPDAGVYGAICDDPDADELIWGKEFLIGHDVMMNKPIVLSTGEWLFPIAVWDRTRGILSDGSKGDSKEDIGSFVYKTSDNGKSFTKLGCSNVPNRSYDEHMVIELNDNSLMMLVRTKYGIGKAYSWDYGKTWGTASDSGLGGPCSRFHIKRLKSGKILLINHVNYTGRNNLTALLSDDEGKTWKWQLLLDERADVSYPDAVETADGFIHIVYDRDRGGFKSSLEEVYASAREILTAKITEEDIINGSLVREGSYLKRVISKLRTFHGADKEYFPLWHMKSDRDLAEYIIGTKDKNHILNAVFERYQVNCSNIHNIDAIRLDQMVNRFCNDGSQDKELLTNIISLIRTAVSVKDDNRYPIVEKISKKIEENITEEVNLEKLAKELDISLYYMCHLFRKFSGTTILQYRNELRLAKAKKLLLNQEQKIMEIALECGFNDASYFSKVFSREVGMSPKDYRKIHIYKIN